MTIHKDNLVLQSGMVTFVLFPVKGRKCCSDFMGGTCWYHSSHFSPKPAMYPPGELPIGRPPKRPEIK